MEFIKKNKNYIIWAGCALMILACFLTFVKVKFSAFGYSDSESIKFLDLTKDEYDLDVLSGYFVLIAAAVSAVLVYLKKEKYSLISTCLALVITFYDFFKVKDALSDAGSMAKITYTAPWIVLVGALVAACPIVLDILR